ncbi:hypothetical protein [Flavobacterium psychrophilum]|uniref:hypothetical protein n=1 Tax=Flavobacterium psychrophilum TaxID=96345 RepID=UPI000B7C4B0D|nr:hypothetical protein [Flavobacterium psychrophilum]EKT4509821.1 hypothetical protein [Flavobacterium psychrophilum]SNB22075.1 conserved hypothetical protein [Flavobacterium psychrophilum]
MKHYDISELDLKNASEEEQIRTRKIFEDLREKARKNEVLLEREKDFLCMCLKISDWNDGIREEFSACENSLFKELYLTYFHNNLEGPFLKVSKGKTIEVSETEKIKDFKTLINISDNWLKQIEIENHKEPIIQELAIETRRDLKKLNQKYSGLNRIFRRQKDDFRLKRDKIILQSKFIYLLIKSVIQNTNNKDFEIPFSNEIIEFGIYSLVHIISRHYAERIKGDEEKTYHYDHFFPTELHLDLKDILLEIDKLNQIDINKTDKIIFKFKNVVYKLWIQERFKQVKGKGNVKIFRIQTFYPIYSETDLKEISEMYTEIDLKENMTVFVKK